MTSRLAGVRPRSALAPLRDAAWLTPDRARAYGALLAVATCLLTAAFYARILAPVLTDPAGRPLASDFDTFWAGARLGLQGNAAAAYDPAAIRQAEADGALPGDGRLFVYLYPPVFLLLCLPLGALPYLAALAAFLLGGFAAFCACVRRILPAPFPLWPILAFPAGLLNAVIGQNGFFSAACFGGFMLLLQRRPALAGACLGCLACKPHLAIGVPVALLAARRWTPLAAAAATACGLVLLSWLVLGTGTWAAFLHAAPLARRMLLDHDIWPKMLSLASAIRILGGGPTLAALAQAAAAIAAIACVIRVARRRPGPGPEGATLVAATLLCTPYLWDYDLVCLGLPLAWLAAQAARTGWRDWERLAAAAAYVGPLLLRMLNVSAGLPLAPVLLAGFLAVITARAAAPPAAGPP